MRRLRPDVVFGADLIAGFPTETEAMFENTLSHRRRMRPDPPPRLPLLAAAGTPAARMPQVDRALVKERAAAPARAGEAALAAHLAAERDAVRHVLVEKNGLGRTEHFTLAGSTGAPGDDRAAHASPAAPRRTLVATALSEAA